MSSESTLTELVTTVSTALTSALEQMEWAEEEITAAQQRHPQAADALHHSFTLLRPTHERMNTEFVFRSHCRELLDRVAHDDDTRPGTAAEVVLALGETALAVPLTDTATGLVFRMWTTAFPEHEIDPNQPHREKLHGSSIDTAEADTRAKLARHDRILDTPDCTGWHHGQPVPCTYAPSTSW